MVESISILQDSQDDLKLFQPSLLTLLQSTAVLRRIYDIERAL